MSVYASQHVCRHRFASKCKLLAPILQQQPSHRALHAVHLPYLIADKARVLQLALLSMNSQRSTVLLHLTPIIQIPCVCPPFNVRVSAVVINDASKRRKKVFTGLKCIPRHGRALSPFNFPSPEALKPSTPATQQAPHPTSPCFTPWNEDCNTRLIAEQLIPLPLAGLGPVSRAFAA